MQKIREIVFLLEGRVMVLLDEFKELETQLKDYTTAHPFERFEDAEELKPLVESMIEIFVELRPIEKLIRFKFKEYGIIFDKLSQILFERENGKFFSFFAATPFGEKRKYTKKNLLPAPNGQSSIE